MCHEMNGNFVAVKKTWKKRSFQFSARKLFQWNFALDGRVRERRPWRLSMVCNENNFLIANRDSDAERKTDASHDL